MSTVETDGSQTATVTTEHTLATVTTAGTFQLMVDTVNMAAGDVLELRIKRPTRAGGTAQTMFYVMYAGVQPTEDVQKVSVPVVMSAAVGSLIFTLKQTLGTGRVYPWAIEKV